MLHKYDCIAALMEQGISHDDATALRRISMTLHRWHELECGNSNDYASRCLVRGWKEDGILLYSDHGKPYMETYFHRGSPKAQYFAIPDRERGALKRLAAIMARYPDLREYVQADPRGASLYILRRADVPPGDISSCYSRGVAVCQ